MVYDFRNNIEEKLGDERFMQLCDVIQAQCDRFPEIMNDMLSYPEKYVERHFGEYSTFLTVDFDDNVFIDICKNGYDDVGEEFYETENMVMVIGKVNGKWRIEF